ncbi:MAG: hypothetical protein ACRECV_15175 [Xanthobacteraceae bacterium]
MLAYIFWHRPFAHVDRGRYEESILRFQGALARHKPPGLLAAASFRIEAVPWLGDQSGYEDWCVLDGSWAMDPLNAFAVSGAAQSPHDNVAAQMEQGQGGIYAHAFGETPPAAQSSIHWLTRPRGIDWRAALEPVRTQCPAANIWRRQMVLGPAAEFAVSVPGETEIAVPAGWRARRVRRVRLSQLA